MIAWSGSAGVGYNFIWTMQPDRRACRSDSCVERVLSRSWWWAGPWQVVLASLGLPEPRPGIPRSHTVVPAARSGSSVRTTTGTRFWSREKICRCCLLSDSVETTFQFLKMVTSQVACRDVPGKERQALAWFRTTSPGPDSPERHYFRTRNMGHTSTTQKESEAGSDRWFPDRIGV